ncbi:hypothetical protein BC830DRAFT_1163187 [Chytriomyces sp. MP71]|nr:hypothetical protein BC830DRAFT_1163187 [Chytriomyces sp. MP71]
MNRRQIRSQRIHRDAGRRNLDLGRSTRRAMVGLLTRPPSTFSIAYSAPAQRERTWGHTRTYPAPPSHAIGNTPGIKVSSAKAQFFKWTQVTDKEPVDFSEDDLYIIDQVPDSDEMMLDSKRKKKSIETGFDSIQPIDDEDDEDEKPVKSKGKGKAIVQEDEEEEEEDEDRMDVDEAQDFGDLKKALSAGIPNPGVGGRLSGLKLNTLASRFLNEQRGDHQDTPPNSAI